MSNYHSRKEKKKLYKKTAFLFLGIFIIGGILGVLLHAADQSKLQAPEESTEEEADLVTIGGENYRPKTSLNTYLFIGVDSSETRPDQVCGGQADTIELLVQDRANDIYYRISIHRNTMATVESFDDDGNSVGKSNLQISYAYAQGDAGEKSCENLMQSVSELLYNYPIDHYVSVTMDAISTINHQLGGVKVTVNDDFSKVDKTLIKGQTITLNDEQAYHFIHERKNVGDGTNENRMNRQNEYLQAAKTNFTAKMKADTSFALDFYDALEPYICTDLSRKKFAKMAEEMVVEKDGGRYQLEGSSEVGRFNEEEYTLDQEQLDDLVTKILFERAE